MNRAAKLGFNQGSFSEGSETLRLEDKMSYFRLPCVRGQSLDARDSWSAPSIHYNPARNMSFISSTINKKPNPLSLRIIGME